MVFPVTQTSSRQRVRRGRGSGGERVRREERVRRGSVKHEK
jgi:hypothetical protein